MKLNPKAPAYEASSTSIKYVPGASSGAIGCYSSAGTLRESMVSGRLSSLPRPSSKREEPSTATDDPPEIKFTRIPNIKVVIRILFNNSSGGYSLECYRPGIPADRIARSLCGTVSINM